MKKVDAAAEVGINPDTDEAKSLGRPKNKHSKLDRSRSFGEITGEVETHPGARYAQDGNLYDGNDNKL